MSSQQLSDPVVRQSIDTIRLLSADAVEKRIPATRNPNGSCADCLPAV